MSSPVQEPATSREFVKQSSLYQEFLAEREEILKHKWLESERLGYDIGFERALLDWIRKQYAGRIESILTELVGPGKVWLQSITLQGLAQALSPYLVTHQEVGEGAALATGAAILGGLLKK